MNNPADYEHLLAEEARVWGNIALQKSRPDWSFVQQMPYQVVYGAEPLRRLIDRVQPGWRVLELGCSSGWLSLEMARRGADVEGIDVAEAAIALAQAYALVHPPSGSVTYRAADINYLPLQTETYDLIVCIGTLHHLAEVEAVMERIHAALKPTGLFYMSEPLDTPPSNALIAGGLMMLLPTHLSYWEKARHLFRLRGQAISHMKDSIEAKGLSPFEGYGRHQDPLELARTLFNIHKYDENNAFTGYVMAQLKMPDSWAIVVGRVLYALDQILTQFKLLRGLTYVIHAGRKS